jgi:hypothetical protein
VTPPGFEPADNSVRYGRNGFTTRRPSIFLWFWKSSEKRTLMNLVPVETPGAGVALTRETLEFFNAALGIVAAGQFLQVVANQLIEARAESNRFLSGAVDQLFINPQGNNHQNSICAHVLCVTRRTAMGLALNANGWVTRQTAWRALAHICRPTVYRNATCILGADEIHHLPKPMAL